MNPKHNRQEIQKYLEIFLSDSYDHEERLKSANDLCEILDSSCNDSDIHILMNDVFEKIKYFLESTEVQNIQEVHLQQLRKACLEVIQKMPNVDVFRPYASAVLSLLFKLVEYENEENALLCVKLIIDLHKFYRPTLSGDVTGFLNFVRKVYRELKNQMDKIFEPHSNLEVEKIEDLDIQNIVLTTFTVTKVKTKISDNNFNLYHILPKSCFSLKVMQEIPILVVLMYQLFKTNIHKDVSEFIPLIMEFINLSPPEEARMSPLFNNDIFIDFLAAQVKTLSFLAYVVKIFQDLIEKYSQNLVQGMMNLLINCPPRVTNMRKEFFIATRHILSVPEIRPKFVDVLDLLMDEDILIGQGYTVRDSLRPLAYSTLADLTHHIRNELTLSKIACAIDLYARNLFDEKLPFSIRQMSLKLLLNLVDCIRQRAVNYQHQNIGSMQPFQLNSASGELNNQFMMDIQKGVARRILLQTLAICVKMCDFVIRNYYPQIEMSSLSDDSINSKKSTESTEPDKDASQKCIPSAFTASSIGLMGGKPFNLNVTVQPCPILSTPNHTGCTKKQEIPMPTESLTQYQLGFADVRALVKSLITGVKTVVASLIQCPHFDQTKKSTENQQTTLQQVPFNHLTNEEIHLLTLYFEYSLKLVDIIQIVPRDGYLFKRSVNPNIKHPDERHLLETLAMTFSQLSTVSFREIFQHVIESFVESCHKSSLCTTMVYHLLNNPNQTSNFGHIFLSYLVDRLHLLGEGNEKSPALMLLFKFCFNAVNMTSTENEYVIKLYILKIVQGSMHLCLTAKEPTAYLTLLRTLFRSIGGGSHDKLYREFFPLLPEMLTTLNRLLRSPHRSHARDLLSELCVIVPVRLSTLMPYLNLLMEPLVYVINCNTVNQGLRTLELCVDNMPPEFLYEHLARVRVDLLHSMKNALYSPIENVQKTTFKVIGKLGRYNRCDIQEMQILPLDISRGESGPYIILYFDEFRNRPIKIYTNQFVEAALDCLVDHTCDSSVKHRAWNLLYTLSTLHFTNIHEKHANHLDISHDAMGISAIVTNPKFRSQFQEFFSLNKNNSSNIGLLSKCRMICSEVDDLECINLIKTFAGLSMIPMTTPCANGNNSSQKSYTEKFNQLTEYAGVFGLIEDVLNVFHTRMPLSHAYLDGLLTILGNEQKDIANFAIDNLIKFINVQLDLAKSLLSEYQPGDHLISVEWVKKLPILDHLSQSIINMLCHPAWYVKWGGCMALIIAHKTLTRHTDTINAWFKANLLSLTNGLLMSFHDLSSQMGQATPRIVTQCLCILLQASFPRRNQGGRSQLLSEYIDRLCLSMISHENTPEIRKHSRFLLHYVAAWTGLPLGELIRDSCFRVIAPVYWLPNSKKELNFCLNKLPCLTQQSILELFLFLLTEPKDFPEKYLCEPIEQTVELSSTWDYITFTLIDEDFGGCNLVEFGTLKSLEDAKFLAEVRSIILTDEVLLSHSKTSSASPSTPLEPNTNNTASSSSSSSRFAHDSIALQVNIKVLAIRLLGETAKLNDSLNFICLCKSLSSVYNKIQDASITCLQRYVRNLRKINLDVDPGLLKHLLKKAFASFWQTWSESSTARISLSTAKNIVCYLEIFPEIITTDFSDHLMYNLNALISDLSIDTNNMLSMKHTSLTNSNKLRNSGQGQGQYANISSSPSSGQPRDATPGPALMNSITSSIKIKEIIGHLLKIFRIIPERIGGETVEGIFSWLLNSVANHGINWLLPSIPHIAAFFSHWPSKVFDVIIFPFVGQETLATDVFMKILEHPESDPLIRYVEENMELELSKNFEDFINLNEEKTTAESYRIHFFIIQLVNRVINRKRITSIQTESDLNKFNDLYWPENWKTLNKVFKSYWISERFYQVFNSLIDIHYVQEMTISTKMNVISVQCPMWELAQKMILNMIAIVVSNPLDVSLHILLFGGIYRLRCLLNMNLIRLFTLYLINKRQRDLSPPDDYQWHRDLLSEYHSLFMEASRNLFNPLDYFQTPEFFSKVLEHLILPALQVGLENGSKTYILGELGNSLEDPNSTDIVGLFIYHWLNEPTARTHTSLRVMHYKLAIVLCKYAPEYIHDVTNKRQSTRLRTLTTFAWPCANSNLSLVDLQEKYSGLQLMVLLMKKFNIGRSIIFQIFQCLVKGTHTETKKIVNPALDALIPAWVQRPDDQRSLACTIKKIMLEDHGTQSSIHILNLIVRNADIFYPIRQQLIPWIICTACRIANQQNQVQIEYKRMILDLLEICVRWIQKQQQIYREKMANSNETSTTKSSSASGGNIQPTPYKPGTLTQAEKTQHDQISNLIIKFACQTIDSNTNGQGIAEQVARKVLTQLEYMFSPEVWGNYDLDLRFSFVNRILNPDDSNQQSLASVSVGSNTTAASVAAATAASQSVSNSSASSKNQAYSGSNISTNTSSIFNHSASILVTIDILRTIVNSSSPQCILANTKQISGSLCNLLVREFSNIRLVRCFSLLFRAYLLRFPAEASNRQKISTNPELVELYNCILKSIQDSFQQFIEASSKSANFIRLQSSFILLSISQQVTTSPYAFVDRCLVQLTKLIRRLITDMMNTSGSSTGSSSNFTGGGNSSNTATNSSSNTSTGDIENSGALTQNIDLLISALEIVKARLSIINNEIRKNAFGPDLSHIIDFTKEPRLLKVVIQIIRDWINVSKNEDQFVPTVKEKIFLFDKLWIAYKRWHDNNEISREILDCIYQVFISNCNRNNELMVRLKQAFCCSLLSQLPDMREKFLKYFLERSNILTFANDEDFAKAEQKPKSLSSSLFFRLMFLLLSNTWDELHFRDLYWLPLFIDVLIVPVREDIEPRLYASYNFKDDATSDHDQESNKVKKEPSDETRTEGSLPMETFKDGNLVNILTNCDKIQGQFHRCNSIEIVQSVSCLYHRRPALADHFFSTFWPQIYNNLLFSNESIKLDEDSEETLHPNELHDLIIPELIKFLSNDQHVSVTNQNMLHSLGAIFNGFITSKSELTKKISFPLITYIAQFYNQRFNSLIYLEKCISEMIPGINDSNNNVDMFLFNSPEMSLITLLEDLDDVDSLRNAWLYFIQQIDGKISVRDRLRSLISSCLYKRQLGHLTNALDMTADVLSVAQEIDDKIIISSGNQLIFTSFLKSKYQKYSIDLMKKLGQWEKLDNLANSCGNLFTTKGRPTTLANMTTNNSVSGQLSTTLHTGQLSMTPQQHQNQQQQQAAAAMAAAGISISSSSPMPSIAIEVKADCAWRNSDWNELYLALAGLGNECTLRDHWKYALMLTSACVAGRRSCYFQQFNDTSTYTSVSSSITNNVLNMIKQSEAEGGRLLQSILKEWRRLPFTINTQHVPIFQACHRTIEVNEGNLVLAQCCGYYLSMTAAANSASSNVNSSNQVSTSTNSPCHSSGPGSNSGQAGANTSSSSITSNYRFPTSQGSHDYKTIFKTWQNRLPLVQDDLSFWNDILDWRQIVAETIINCNTHSTKSQERANLVAICQRELGISRLQLAKGARKHGLTSVSTQHLQRYTASNLPNNFEKIKQEIKIRLAENKKEDLLEGLELIEKTDIRTFDKKDRAKFFCAKAVFFSHFNKGDEATKNFGYATQMQDNVHKLWSVYGDFLENVYTSYPPQKRELAASTTGVFAMQALMEAVSVAGIAEKKARPDMAKCLWLLTLDDSGLATATNNSNQPQQKLAKIFEERSSRLSPEAMLPWLSSLVLSLLRPEGRYTVTALKNFIATYPSALYSQLKVLLESLTNEIESYGLKITRVTGMISTTLPENEEPFPVLETQYKEGESTKIVSLVISKNSEKIPPTKDLMKESPENYETITESDMSQTETSQEDNKHFDQEYFRLKSTGKKVNNKQILDYSGKMVEKNEAKILLKVRDSVRETNVPTSTLHAFHRVNYLMRLIEKNAPAKAYVYDRFVDKICSRLMPSKTSQLIGQLSEFLTHIEDLLFNRLNDVDREAAISKPMPIWLHNVLSGMLVGKFSPPPSKSTFDRVAEETLNMTSKRFSKQYDALLKSLSESLDSIARNEPILKYIEVIVNDWLPRLEQFNQSYEPKSFYLTERGVNHFSELCSLTSISSPNYPCPKPSISTLALPGEWNFINQSPTPQATHFTPLTIVEVLPFARMTKYSVKSRGTSSHATVFHLRASNGRIHSYSLTPSRLNDLRPNEREFYELHRENRPVHLAQMINELLSKESQTSKRRVRLEIPRQEILTSHGVVIKESGRSSMTSSVAFSAASSTIPLAAHFTRPGFARVNQPPATNHPTMPPNHKTILKNALTPGGLDKRFIDESAKFPTSSINSTNNSYFSGGSTVVLLEARGRPCSQDNCVFIANESLSSIIDKSLDSTTSCNLRQMKYEYLRKIINSDPVHRENLHSLVVRIIEEIKKNNLQKTQQDLLNPSIKTIKVLMKENENKMRWSNQIFTNWAMNWMENAEAYWLFRRSLNEQFGSWLLIMQLMHQTTSWDPDSLTINLRNGYAHIDNLKFLLFIDAQAVQKPTGTEKFHGILQSHFGFYQKHESTSACHSSGHNLCNLLLQDHVYKYHEEKTGHLVLENLHLEPSTITKFQMSPQILEFLLRPLDFEIMPSVMEITYTALINRKSLLNVYQRTIYRDDLILHHKSRQVALAKLTFANANKTQQPSLIGDETLPDLPNDKLIHSVFTLMDSTNLITKKLSAYCTGQEGEPSKSSASSASGTSTVVVETFQSLVKSSIDPKNISLCSLRPSKIPWI